MPQLTGVNTKLYNFSGGRQQQNNCTCCCTENKDKLKINWNILVVNLSIICDVRKLWGSKHSSILENTTMLYTTQHLKKHNISWKIKTKRKCNISHFKKFCCGLLNVVVLLKLSLHFPKMSCFVKCCVLNFVLFWPLGPPYKHTCI